MHCSLRLLSEKRTKHRNSHHCLPRWWHSVASLIHAIIKISEWIEKVFDFSDVEEFTIEVNPDDVTPECIQQSKSLGINRVSMGVQSFSDEDLRFINRRHTAKQATDAIHIIKEAGIDNISIDLIYGIPGQNFEIWKIM